MTTPLRPLALHAILGLLTIAGAAGCAASAEPPDSPDELAADADLADLSSVDDGELIPAEAQPSITFEELDPAALAAAPAVACAINVSAPTQLMITSLPVVNDPVRTRWTGALTNPADGAWSFGRLMTEMAGANDPTTYMRSWLAQFDQNVTVNQQNVFPNKTIKVLISSWPKTAAGKLDLAKAPFTLQAIVNRFDLRAPGNAGELRFIYYARLPVNLNVFRDFAVILEYKMAAPTAADVKTWANLWKDLGTAPLGSVAYRTKLQAITDRVTKRGRAPGKINGSAISQVRTNSLDEFSETWDMREFRLTTTGQLRMASPALTPRDDLAPATLAQFVKQNAAAIKAETHTVPALFNGAPFAAGMSRNVLSGTAWLVPGVTDSTLRFRFSVNTCNGCHSLNETGAQANHVRDRQTATSEATLSPFLTGGTVPDPVTHVPRTFNELARRSNLLKAYLCANP
jgi:hypothetical protein